MDLDTESHAFWISIDIGYAFTIEVKDAKGDVLGFKYSPYFTTKRFTLYEVPLLDKNNSIPMCHTIIITYSKKV